MTGILLLLGSVLVLLFGTPLFAVIGGAAFAQGLILDQNSAGIVGEIYNKFTSNSTLMTIPLFTFAGYLMAESKTSDRLVKLFRAFFGWMPGGLAIVALIVCAFFTTFTGASGVTIIAMGGLLLPILIKDKYGSDFSLGLVTSSGSLGLLFPPSLPVIVYGFIAAQDIPVLFVSGIVPGLLMIILLSGYAIWVGKKAKMERTPFTWKNAKSSLWEAKWEALIPVLVFGLFFSGITTIPDTAIVTAIYVLIIEVFVYKDLHLTRDIPKVIKDCMVLVGGIMIILAAAFGLTNWLAMAEVPEKIFSFFSETLSNKYVFLLALNLLLLLVGCMMDIFSAIIVVVPLIIPLANKFGVDPFHLAVIFLTNLEIGYITPPVGLNLFIASLRFNQPILKLYKVVLPFFGIRLIGLALITYLPFLTTGLVKLFGMEPKASKAISEVQLDDPLPGGKKGTGPPRLKKGGAGVPLPNLGKDGEVPLPDLGGGKKGKDDGEVPLPDLGGGKKGKDDGEVPLPDLGGDKKKKDDGEVPLPKLGGDKKDKDDGDVPLPDLGGDKKK